VVPVENDLEALRLYIELEQIRYSDRFEACIQVDNEVLEGNYCIPPMIIQPYVENAILHGLRNLPSGNGTLKIHVSKKASYLQINIEDNGIGRLKSAALRKNDLIKRTSLGMSVTQDRISIFNNLTPQRKAAVHMFDLDPGTRVELVFPLSD
jgi:LytS/YehU family sensor histidine kinase